MKTSKNNLFAAVGLLLGIASAHADSSSDASIKAPQPSGYWESKDGFYVSLDGGAVFLNTPKKDNSNFFSDGNFNGQFVEASGGSLRAFDTDSTGGFSGGKIGYVFDRKPSESWLGENLRVEGSGSYFQSGASDSGSLSNTSGNFGNFWAEQLDGRNYNFIGDNYFSEGTQDSAVVTETTNDYFYEGAAVIKTDYFLGKDHEFTFTPSLGFDYSHLGQHFQTNVNGLESGEGGTIPIGLDQEEKVNTDYYGLVFGFDLRANVSKNFVMFLDGSITPELAYSSYFGHQSGTDVTTNEASDHANQFTFTGSLMGGFSYDFGPVILTLSGGFRYWDYVGTVKEAEVPNGSQFDLTTPNQPSHLVSGDMLNPQMTASVVIPF